MRTAVYLRISRDKLGLELGVDRQRADCRRLVAQRRWPRPVEFVDNDISATHGRRRPGYEELIAAIRARQVNRVVVWHPSRLWRNRRERAEGIELFRQYKVTLACVRGPELDLGSAYGRLAADLFGAFDSSESEVKAERVEGEALQRAKRGLPHGGPRRYGYTKSGMELVPEEAEKLRAAYRAILGGRSLVGVAREIGVNHSSLRFALLNEHNAGFRRLRGQEYPGKWPAIVDRATFEAVGAILTHPSRKTNTANSARRWLGSGLYYCLRCERTVGVSYAGANNGRRRIYVCRAIRGGCSRAWRADALDEFVVALVRERLSRPDLADLLPVDRPDLEALRDEAAGIRARLKKLQADYVLLGLSEAELREGLEVGRRRLAEIEKALGETRRGGALGELLTAEDPVAVWDAIPAEQVDRRQAVIRALMTIRLDASPRGRRWDPERFVLVGPPS